VVSREWTKVDSHLRQEITSTYHSLLTVFENGGVIAPTFPGPALVLSDGFVVQHATQQRRDVGLVAIAALLEVPLSTLREYR